MTISDRAASPVGQTEIAAMAGVSQRTVDQWTRRHADFPPPRWQVGGRPAWDATDIEQWLADTGRPYSPTRDTMRSIDTAAARRLADAYETAVAGGAVTPLRVAATRAGTSELVAETLLPLGAQLLADEGRAPSAALAAEVQRLADQSARDSDKPTPVAYVRRPDDSDLVAGIMARLVERRNAAQWDTTSWTDVSELAGLAPGETVPVYAYAHDLDDADLGETRGFDQDATGLAPEWVGAYGQPVPVRWRTEPLPIIRETLDQLVAAGRVERHPIYGSYRPA